MNKFNSDTLRRSVMSRITDGVRGTEKQFYVHGFGIVGLPNLLKFIPNNGEKSQYELSVHESCFGTTPDGPEKITRIEDRKGSK